ncbi:hypothetical protein [Cohnella silvisoli]|uniref:hypothetical protein n=1 Tax=Cohnella silvisoli TaxID=2873699 RepID=UPI0035A0D8B0|nr:hypothetical protein [Cohnella silvisoli]
MSSDNRIVSASAVGQNANIVNDMRLAEMLIHKQAKLDPHALMDASVKIKSILKG